MPASRRSLLAILLAVSLTRSSLLRAAEEPSPVPGKRVALQGYDPVSYFADGRPEKGSSAFWLAFDDTVYLFKNAEHRAAFANDSERYAPQYDGFCAMTVSTGVKAEADPEAWIIADGKLFVFRSKAGVAAFNKNAPAVASQADSHWQSIKKAR